MRTAHSLLYGGVSVQLGVSVGGGEFCPVGDLCQGDSPGQSPLKEHGTRDRTPLEDIEPGSETGSDITQRLPPEQNDTCE